MSAVDEIIEILHNGDWHKLAEVAKKTRTEKSKIELISSFLSTYDFVEYDRKTKLIRLSAGVLNFLNKVELIERKEAVSKRSLFS